jgi:hypothetical protein
LHFNILHASGDLILGIIFILISLPCSNAGSSWSLWKPGVPPWRLYLLGPAILVEKRIVVKRHVAADIKGMIRERKGEADRGTAQARFPWTGGRHRVVIDIRGTRDETGR